MNIASFIDNTSLSQNLFYMTKTFNQLGKENISPFCFYSNLSTQDIKPEFAVMNCYYANHYYNGPSIATSISSLKILSSLNIKSRKYFYCWDLEWLRLGDPDSMNYSDNMGLFRNEYITIIARSESHARCIENYTNRKISHIIEDWDYNQIKDLTWNCTKS